ncbi:MAG TPA: exodeoxyribonuclease III [Rudaea sp.]|jgi:exodeoxyribonuclease-3
MTGSESDARSGSGCGHLRIASWNIENLAPMLASDAHDSLGQVIERLQYPDVLCLQEVRLRPGDANLIAAARSALPGYRCHMSLNHDERNASYRGGRAYGVVTFSRESLGGEQELYAWDREGRVVITHLPVAHLAIANVYAVNGTSKPYWSHELGRWDGDRHAFKRRFIERLAQEWDALRASGLRLVLVGDWNISRTRLDTWPRLRTQEPHATARAEFNDRFIPGLDLVDAFRELHPAERKYTWFNRRARGDRLDAARVDFALVSRSLMPRVTNADIDQERSARGRSDHAPLWIDLAMAS